MNDTDTNENRGSVFDDVFHTLLADGVRLIIPVINEIFNEAYTGAEQIEFKPNEHTFKDESGATHRRITDSLLSIERGGVKQQYHLECQRTSSGDMLLRVYEYGALISRRNYVLTDSSLEITFPKSAVLYLKHTASTPDIFTIKINVPGDSAEYAVPALKVTAYGLDSIVHKKLLFLFPFYILRYEKELEELDGSESGLRNLRNDYESMKKFMEELCEGDELDEYTKRLICDMSVHVVNHVASKYANIKEEVFGAMGGVILDYEAKDIRNRALEEGIEKGIEKGELLAYRNLVEKNLLSIADAASQFGITPKELAVRFSKL